MAVTTLAQLPTGNDAKDANSNTGARFKQVLAYVPSEIVTLYVGLDAALPSLKAVTTENQSAFQIGNAIFCAVLVPIVIIISNVRSTTQLPLGVLVWRIVAGLISFGIWIAAIGKLTTHASDWITAVAGLALIGGPFVLQMIGSVIDTNAPART